jgi:uncharacterized protein
MAAETNGIELRSIPGGVEFTVKVVPGASRTGIVGTWGTALKVAVAAPPEAGKANAAVIKLLAGALGVKKADVTIVHGQSQPVKRIAVRGVTGDQARARLAKP